MRIKVPRQLSYFVSRGGNQKPIRKTLEQGLAKLETVDERQIVSQPTMAKGHSPLSAIVQSGWEWEWIYKMWASWMPPLSCFFLPHFAKSIIAGQNL